PPLEQVQAVIWVMVDNGVSRNAAKVYVLELTASELIKGSRDEQMGRRILAAEGRRAVEKVVRSPAGVPEQTRADRGAVAVGQERVRSFAGYEPLNGRSHGVEWGSSASHVFAPPEIGERCRLQLY